MHSLDLLRVVLQEFRLAHEQQLFEERERTRHQIETLQRQLDTHDTNAKADQQDAAEVCDGGDSSTKLPSRLTDRPRCTQAMSAALKGQRVSNSC